MQIHFRDSHAYVGCRARVLDFAETDVRGETVIEFSDGSNATGQFQSVNANELQLWIAPYITEKGTSVSGHNWRLQRDPKTGVWKIGRRTP